MSCSYRLFWYFKLCRFPSRNAVLKYSAGVAKNLGHCGAVVLGIQYYCTVLYHTSTVQQRFHRHRFMVYFVLCFITIIKLKRAIQFCEILYDT